MLLKTSSQEVSHMEPITDKSQEVFYLNKTNTNIMRLEDTILAAAYEESIEKKLCLLKNQPTCNTLINGNYLSNIRDTPDGKYLRVH